MAPKTLGQTTTWLHSLTYQANKLFRRRLSVLEARHKETVGKILLVLIQVFFFYFYLWDYRFITEDVKEYESTARQRVTKVKVSNKGACVLLEHGAQHGGT